MNLPPGAITLCMFILGLIPTESQTLVCPAVRTSSGWLDLFPLPCRKNAECRVMSKQHLCCKGFCTKGATATAAIQSTRNRQNSSSVVETRSISTSTSTTMSTTPSTTTSTTASTTTTPTTTTSTITTTTPSTTTSTTTTTTPSTTTSTTTTTTPSTTTSTTPSTTTTTTTTTPSTTSSTTTLPPPPPPTPATTTTTGISLPFLQLLPIQRIEASTVKNSAPIKTSNSVTGDVTYSHTRDFNTVYKYNLDYASAGKTQKLVCPKPGQSPVVLFPIPCDNNAQCRTSSGPDQVCCEKRCVKGIPAPRPTSAPQTHQPLLGVVPRECPSAPLGELLFEVQSCKTDADCWPRICCPDGTRSYCRTARARLDLVPIANQIDGPVRVLEQYLQCTAPPQYDVFPQKCSSSVDCFPNLCCAEGGKKHCRPPQRSILSLLAGVTQRVGSTLGNIRQAQANRNNV